MVNLVYKTFLPDGKLIDGSDLIGKPLPYFIGINMTIKGWDEVFVNLKPGDKIKLHLPSEKAYGKKGFGTMVPPNTDLDFDIEVIDKVAPITTPSGLKYYYLVQNEKGKPTKEGSNVEIHYYGWVFSESKLFDSSHFNGKTYKFKVGGGEEILCWEEIVKLMRDKEKILMVVPPELGYAEKGVPEMVPPNSKLIYLIEMMKIS
jgi:FKBP-type peptidyl-prolyl cis-trans isomerase